MRRVLLIAGLLSALCTAPPGGSDPAEDPLLVGVFPRRNPELTQAMFTPLTRYLGEQLQRPVILHTTYDFASFWDSVGQNQYHLVHYNQYHYIRSHHEHGYRVIAQNEEFGYDKIAPAVIVRKDSGLASLQDLRGRKIVFGGGRKAMIAYIGTTFLLRQAGLNEGEYFEQFALTPIKATIATYYRQAAATGAGHYVLRLPVVEEQIDQDALTYLAIGEPHAHLPWAIGPQVTDELAVKLQSLLVGLKTHPDGRAILQRAKLTALNPASDADYDTYRDITKVVLGEDYPR